MMNLDFKKLNGLVPAVIQDARTLNILMLGFMNEEALTKTVNEGKVTFFSRTKNRLWTKGETSGNFLYVKEIYPDCDSDSLLIRVNPAGPVCHTGNTSCFNNDSPEGFLYRLEKIVRSRIDEDAKDSYTNRIFREGINKAAQKVGEEAVELIIEAKDDNNELFISEAADLLYHLLILFRSKNVTLRNVEKRLASRHSGSR